MPAQTVIKIRRDTSTNWSSVNPTLAAGEIAFETDTNKIKVGDGSTVWASLDYASGAGTAAEISYDNVDAELIATTVKAALDELSNNKVDPADLTAVNTSADTTNFTGNLSGSDTTVQAALDTLDDLEITAGVTTSDTPPSSPSNGDLWWESDTGILFIYYDNFWVEAVSGIVGPQGESGAVISTTEPADQDVLWVDTSSSATAESTLNNGTQGLSAVSNGSSGLSYQPVSHNYIINGAFDIWQRGDSFTNPASGDKLSDRFLLTYNGSGATRTISKQSITPGEVSSAAMGEPEYALRFDTSVAGTGESFVNFATQLEDVRTLAGRNITFSFYAKASSTVTMNNIRFLQRFGSGGSSPVAENIGDASVGVEIGTSWQRFTFTDTVPSITGKTIGEGSSLDIQFFMPISQTFTIDITGVQLEAGSIATPFKRNANSIQGELAACQRYYQKFRMYFGTHFAGTTTAYREFETVSFKPNMRATPSISFTEITNTNVTENTTIALNNTAARHFFRPTSTGGTELQNEYEIDAEL